MRQASEVELPARISYAEFGERFVAHAVTPARIDAAVSGLAGPFELGPFAVGPGKLARVTVRGDSGAPTIARAGSEVVFAVRIPVRLELTVTLGGRELKLAAAVDIDLTLHARTADPLLVVIDIPPITKRAVSPPVIRAEAVDAEARVLLEPTAKMIRKEVADRLNAMLSEPEARRARIFDVEAISAGEVAAPGDLARFDWIDYAEFGRRFLPRMVTPARVRAVAESLSGRVIDVESQRAGPRDAAEVTARGVIRLPRVTERTGADTVTFDMVVPVTLDVVVDVRKSDHYHAEVEIPLVLVTRTAAPLLIVIDVEQPDASQIDVRLQADGLRARTIGVLGSMRRRIAAQVSAAVSRHLADPSLRTVDVAARLEATRLHESGDSR
ncbi:hypothetical protein [Nocardia macrotermitis]|uniref:Uncharacterized protein n=1 Tax=Nocardia macrotermitis TaxID=2585198 RepID=A0A7K0D3B0_9NOCA|nr:hypothetical protein [Nocardia macrotermitis]MQY20223.1 hypothetical protein [Nocardia macrotermitis]